MLSIRNWVVLVKWDIYINPSLPSRIRNNHIRSNRKKWAKGWRWIVWDTNFWTWHGYITGELKLPDCTCIRSKQPEFYIGEVLSRTYPLLMSFWKLTAAGEEWIIIYLFFLNVGVFHVWPPVDFPCPSGWFHTSTDTDNTNWTWYCCLFMSLLRGPATQLPNKSPTEGYV